MSLVRPIKTTQLDRKCWNQLMQQHKRDPRLNQVATCPWLHRVAVVQAPDSGIYTTNDASVTVHFYGTPWRTLAMLSVAIPFVCVGTLVSGIGSAIESLVRRLNWSQRGYSIDCRYYLTSDSKAYEAVLQATKQHEQVLIGHKNNKVEELA